MNFFGNGIEFINFIVQIPLTLIDKCFLSGDNRDYGKNISTHPTKDSLEYYVKPTTGENENMSKALKI